MHPPADSDWQVETLKPKLFNLAVRPPSRQTGWAGIKGVSPLPDLPVMAGTLLAMELKSQECGVQLSDVAALIRRDLGAVARIFRYSKIGQANDHEEQR